MKPETKINLSKFFGILFVSCMMGVEHWYTARVAWDHTYEPFVSGLAGLCGWFVGLSIAYFLLFPKNNQNVIK